MSEKIAHAKRRFLWGAAAIGEAAGTSERKAFHLLEMGVLPGRKIRGRWCSTVEEIEEALLGGGTESGAA